jgi:hypothetical protein
LVRREPCRMAIDTTRFAPKLLAASSTTPPGSEKTSPGLCTCNSRRVRASRRTLRSRLGCRIGDGQTPFRTRSRMLANHRRHEAPDFPSTTIAHSATLQVIRSRLGASTAELGQRGHVIPCGHAAQQARLRSACRQWRSTRLTRPFRERAVRAIEHHLIGHQVLPVVRVGIEAEQYRSATCRACARVCMHISASRWSPLASSALPAGLGQSCHCCRSGQWPFGTRVSGGTDPRQPEEESTMTQYPLSVHSVEGEVSAPPTIEQMQHFQKQIGILEEEPNRVRKKRFLTTRAG